MKTFHLEIVTPKGVYRKVDVEMLNLRTTTGQIGIYANHIPLASVIEISDMDYIEDGKRNIFAIAGGFVYVNDIETTIIANAIESQEEIDLLRAEDAKARAEEILNRKENNMDIARAEIALKKALTRIKVKQL